MKKIVEMDRSNWDWNWEKEKVEAALNVSFFQVAPSLHILLFEPSPQKPCWCAQLIILYDTGCTVKVSILSVSVRHRLFNPNA